LREKALARELEIAQRSLRDKEREVSEKDALISRLQEQLAAQSR